MGLKKPFRTVAGALIVLALGAPAGTASAAELLEVTGVRVVCGAEGMRVTASGYTNALGWSDVRLADRGRVGTTKAFALVGTPPGKPAGQALQSVRASAVVAVSRDVTRVAVTARGSVEMADVPRQC